MPTIANIIRRSQSRKARNILSTGYSPAFIDKFQNIDADFYIWVTEPEKITPHPNVFPMSEVPMDLELDLVICHDRIQSYKWAMNLASSYHIEFILIEHTLIEQYPQYKSYSITPWKTLYCSEELARDWNGELILKDDLSNFKELVEPLPALYKI